MTPDGIRKEECTRLRPISNDIIADVHTGPYSIQHSGKGQVHLPFPSSIDNRSTKVLCGGATISFSVTHFSEVKSRGALNGLGLGVGQSALDKSSLESEIAEAKVKAIDPTNE